MRKYKDPNTGIIKYIKTEEDLDREKLVKRVSDLELKVKHIENLLKKEKSASKNKAGE